MYCLPDLHARRWRKRKIPEQQGENSEQHRGKRGEKAGIRWNEQGKAYIGVGTRSNIGRRLRVYDSTKSVYCRLSDADPRH